MLNDKKMKNVIDATIENMCNVFDNARTNTRNDALIICDVATSTHATRTHVDVDDEIDNMFIDMKLSCM